MAIKYSWGKLDEIFRTKIKFNVIKSLPEAKKSHLRHFVHNHNFNLTVALEVKSGDHRTCLHKIVSVHLVDIDTFHSEVKAFCTAVVEIDRRAEPADRPALTSAETVSKSTLIVGQRWNPEAVARRYPLLWQKVQSINDRVVLEGYETLLFIWITRRKSWELAWASLAHVSMASAQQNTNMSVDIMGGSCKSKTDVFKCISHHQTVSQ